MYMTKCTNVNDSLENYHRWNCRGLGHKIALSTLRHQCLLNDWGTDNLPNTYDSFDVFLANMVKCESYKSGHKRIDRAY